LPVLSRFMGKERDLSKSTQTLYENLNKEQQKVVGVNAKLKDKAQVIYDDLKDLQPE